MDRIFVNRIILKVCFSNSEVSSNQPNTLLYLSISLNEQSVEEAASTDDLKLTKDYSKLVQNIIESIDGKVYQDLHCLAKNVIEICLQQCSFSSSNEANIRIKLEQPRSNLRSSATGIVMEYKNGSYGNVSSFIHKLQLCPVIGVLSIERIQRQLVEGNIEVTQYVDDIDLITKIISENVDATNFLTLEALAVHVAQLILEHFQKNIGNETEVKVCLAKPNVLTFAEGPGVEVVRTTKTKFPAPINGDSGKFVNVLEISEKLDPKKKNHVEALPYSSYISFGSNIEPRITHINDALKRLEEFEHIKIVDTSFMYESVPMYKIDQAYFLNGVIRIKTCLDPHQLLNVLTKVEQLGNRKRIEKNGPRTIDLDIILFDEIIMKNEHITIPHPRMNERPFVLQPLSDISPELIHPKFNLSIQKLLDQLYLKCPKERLNLKRVLPIPNPINPLNPWKFVWGSKTFIMGILNLSLDSFSEPGTTEPSQIFDKVKQMEADDADLIDIGAVSRKPGSSEALSSEDEISLLRSTITSLRNSKFTKVPFSIDVYKSKVAEEALISGANIINDIGMAKRDPKILQVASNYQSPIIFMHTRGSPAEMRNLNDYDSHGGVVNGVINELRETVEKAINAGIYRWNIILDPGIGFAKDGKQNMQLLQNLDQFTVEQNSKFSRFPILVGVSRKKFIGLITNTKDDPLERDAGSLAALASCISKNVDIARVHNVSSSAKAAKFSDAFWKH